MKRRYGQKKRHGKTLLTLAALLMLAALVLAGGSSVAFSEITNVVNTKSFTFPELTIEDVKYVEAAASQSAAAGKISWHWYDTEDAEDVSIKSNDGLILKGIIYKQPEKKANKWVILLHGYSSNKEAMRGFAQKYFENGYNLLIPDLRAHGESEGVQCGMGWLDRLDLIQWVKSIVSRDKNAEIILHGVSLGADAAMMASGEELPKNVKVIIEDSGYSSVWDILKYHLNYSYNAPAFPLLNGANLWSKSGWGFDWKEASAAEQVKKSKTPILFIHGGDDSFVPTSMAYELYQAACCEKRLLIIEGAAHASSAISDPDRYWEAVFGFINKYVKW